ncbi:hypothetical protein SCATT_39180 [Streptantibioticus cattleyicolor NRRL 8057 = DSM 46488]|uniref:Tn3 transposase DDE domain-containing protein n=1 Tax=Streptantibioticus cattleyicolor (strain ATCC 35852 / DSM 46488 / JCM 4925 / NBRC 14057 / NRRL 8057) TaxID=1003195 RepID=G8WSQ4_STREN|nr:MULTISPECIES: Tn3 family transposase [Streptomycetaceae]AEW96289.1 hypothetical protein SCATT_39180 [Streptantibioticus cattleyicolor NRRL 8057 = DSM 46488]
MEDQLGALGLVLNAVVLWTTRYIDAAVAQLHAEGPEIWDEGIARMSCSSTVTSIRWAATASPCAAVVARPGRARAR